MTLCLRYTHPIIFHNIEMSRDTYIAPIVEAYMPDASFEEKLALTQEFWALFDVLYASFLRFDSLPLPEVESDSPNPTKI